jgi:catechol 2,3-dioxygenase-like lactoylglutathione lyase family enzyme
LSASNGDGARNITSWNVRHCVSFVAIGLSHWPKDQQKEQSLKIVLTSMLVNDQAKALAFYRDILGFELKHDIPLGRHRWLTLTSPGDAEGVELVLEPDEHPAARPFKEALVADGIPYTSFAVDDVHAEHSRLVAAGVRFTQPPTAMGPVTTAVLDDTCGNLIQIAQRH